MKYRYPIKFIIVLFFILIKSLSFAQNRNLNTDDKLIVSRMMDSIWISPTSFINHDSHNWIRLNEHIEKIDLLQINEIIHSIFFGEKSFILNESHAYEGFIGTLNNKANNKKLKKYHKKIRKGYRDVNLYPKNKIVLIEGDSWFEFPVFLKDITNHLEDNPNLLIYSRAHLGDWISNMLSSLKYQYDYSKIKPDVLIISGGGNDFVGDYRLSNFIRITPKEKDNFNYNKYKKYVTGKIEKSILTKKYLTNSNYKDSISTVDTVLVNQIVEGRRYLNKNFYRFLASLKIEYKMLFESLEKMDPIQFNSTKIITQGYDYSIPSFKRNFGLRMFFKNGEWLKEPMMINGINDSYTQEAIIKTIIFEINEMLIELGKEYNNLYHVDSRGFTEFYERYKHKKKGSYWLDELHPKSNVLKIISDVYIDIIEGNFDKNQRVFNVKDTFLKKEISKKKS